MARRYLGQFLGKSLNAKLCKRKIVVFVAIVEKTQYFFKIECEKLHFAAQSFFVWINAQRNIS